MLAKECADVAIGYLNEHDDGEQTRWLIEEHRRTCVTIPGDSAQKRSADEWSSAPWRSSGKLDILVNNRCRSAPAGFDREHQRSSSSPRSARATSRCSISQSSVEAPEGSAELLDRSATKRAIVASTRSLSQNLAEKGERRCARPIWTPLIPSTFDEEKVASFGADVPLKRPGQPEEGASGYVFLASDD